MGNSTVSHLRMILAGALGFIALGCGSGTENSNIPAGAAGRNGQGLLVRAKETELGTFMNYSGAGPASGYTFRTSADYIVNIDGTGKIATFPIYFESGDCTGQALVLKSQVGVPGHIFNSRDGNESYYFIPFDAAASSRALNSELSTTGSCAANSQTVDVYSVTSVTGDNVASVGLVLPSSIEGGSANIYPLPITLAEPEPEVEGE